MRATFYLKFNKKRVTGINKNKMPPLQSGEYAIRLTVVVPEIYFTRAIPSAEIVVPEGAIMAAPVVTVEAPPEVPA